jgi:hypothetical protein
METGGKEKNGPIGISEDGVGLVLVLGDANF